MHLHSLRSRGEDGVERWQIKYKTGGDSGAAGKVREGAEQAKEKTLQRAGELREEAIFRKDKFEERVRHVGSAMTRRPTRCEKRMTSLLATWIVRASVSSAQRTTSRRPIPSRPCTTRSAFASPRAGPLLWRRLAAGAGGCALLEELTARARELRRTRRLVDPGNRTLLGKRVQAMTGRNTGTLDERVAPEDRPIRELLSDLWKQFADPDQRGAEARDHRARKPRWTRPRPI